MFKLYRKSDCINCLEIQNLLEELDYDLKVVVIEEENNVDELPEDIMLPVLIDDNNILQGSNAILKRIEELESFKVFENHQSYSCDCNKK